MPRGRDPRRHLDSRLAQPREEDAHRRPVEGGPVEEILEPEPRAHLPGPFDLPELPRSQGGPVDLVRGLHLGEPVFAFEGAQDLLAPPVVV
ncbi:MAG TPA: hypothetical protein PKX99_07540, partial [Thermoanaerobaculia bacterium]|nr:hypothetical protein [Thermoanaerobaculia bacterium]